MRTKDGQGRCVWQLGMNIGVRIRILGIGVGYYYCLSQEMDIFVRGTLRRLMIVA